MDSPAAIRPDRGETPDAHLIEPARGNLLRRTARALRSTSPVSRASSYIVNLCCPGVFVGCHFPRIRDELSKSAGNQDGMIGKASSRWYSNPLSPSWESRRKVPRMVNGLSMTFTG